MNAQKRQEVATSCKLQDFAFAEVSWEQTAFSHYKKKTKNWWIGFIKKTRFPFDTDWSFISRCLLILVPLKKKEVSISIPAQRNFGKSVLLKCYREMVCPKNSASTLPVAYLIIPVDLICHEFFSLSSQNRVALVLNGKRTARTTRQRECRFCNATCQSRCIVSRSTLSSIKTTETYKARQWLLRDFSIISDILLSEANKPRASLLNCGNRRIPPYRVSSGVWESFSMFVVDTD